MNERKVEPGSCVLTWTTPGGSLDPSDLSEIADRLHMHIHDALPGSAIAAISYDGERLEVTLT